MVRSYTSVRLESGIHLGAVHTFIINSKPKDPVTCTCFYDICKKKKKGAKKIVKNKVTVSSVCNTHTKKPISPTQS